jgi:hypothetical protein
VRAIASALLVTLAVAVAGACGGDDGAGPDAAALASPLCARLQKWIDGVEASSTELSDRTTAQPDPAGRKPHFEAWIDDVIEQTEAMAADVEALGQPTEPAGIADGLEILEDTRTEIDAMPEDDRESLGYRVARVFLSMENVFAKVRTSVERLGADDDAVAEALEDDPACRDYNDPLT